MSTIVSPAIKGRMGDTEFYETTMSARALVMGVRAAHELDTWASMGIEERMQREPDTGRILKDIAPYLARSKDRFFGSILVLVYEGEIQFESLRDVVKQIPNAYKAEAEKIGFISINGGLLIVLDGQHRLLAMEKVIKMDVTGPFAGDVPNDDVCVIFIKHDSDEKTRRIFNKVNRYAKTTSRGDNIITSEDDGYAIVARRLLRDGEVLGNINGNEIVNWKSNTLSPRSTKLTTISAIYETIKLILAAGGVKLNEQERPSEDKLDEYFNEVSEFWTILLHDLLPYQQALEDVSRLPELREEDAPYSLLFKPAAQIALVKGLLIAIGGGRLMLSEAVDRANQIDWCINSDLWKDVIISSRGSIDATSAAREPTAQLIAYLIAGDLMEAAEIEAIQEEINRITGEERTLPEPVAL